MIKSRLNTNAKHTNCATQKNGLTIRSLTLYGIITTMLLCSCFIISATPWVDSTLDNASYIEQEGWKKLDTNVTVSSTTDNFNEGYFILNITDNSSSYDSFRVVSNGSLDVNGDAVYWESTRIGTIDSTYDGSNGTLRIDFTSSVSLPNSGFETGDTTGWTVNTSYPGVTGQAWVESPFDDPDVVTGPGANNDPLVDDHSSVTQTSTVQTPQVYDGTYALKLTIGGSVSKGFGTAHGPMITSSTFNADEGDNLSVRWYAQAGGDWYDVYGFIFRDDDNDGIWDDSEQYQKLFHDVGSDTGGWIATNETISSNVSGSNIRFLFLNGNYDNTGGQGIGSSLYIDGIILNINSSLTVNNTIVESVIENIEYSNDGDAPDIIKTCNLTLKESNNDVDSNTASILITAVNDIPGVPGNFTNPLQGYSVERGKLLNITWGDATDPDGDDLFYDLWFYNGTWTQIGDMLNTSNMLFTMPSDNVTEGKFKVYANDTLLNSTEVNVTFDILDAPEFTYTPEDQEQLSTYNEEFNFTIASTLLSSFEWFVDNSPISGSGFTIVNTSQNSYCLINASQYINDSDFFMNTYNISVVVNNASLQRNDTYSWEWTVTESSAADEGSDISFIVNGSVNTTSYGNESYVRVNTTYNDDQDEDGLDCSIIFVEFNTTEDPSGILLKVEVVSKSSINTSGAGFTQDDVYQYIDIGTSNHTLVNNDSYSRNIEFKILNELDGGNLVINSVALKHLNTSIWETYTPAMLSNDGTYSYFIVYNVSGFSPFAVLADYSSGSTTSSSDDGMPYYLKKQIQEQNEQEMAEEVTEEVAEEAVSPDTVVGEDGNTDRGYSTSSEYSVTTDDKDGNYSGMVMLAGIPLIILGLLFILWKRRKDEEENQ